MLIFIVMFAILKTVRQETAQTRTGRDSQHSS
nr:MAG TPA: hypothetical protein [Caudoviricetes sp.]